MVNKCCVRNCSNTTKEAKLFIVPTGIKNEFKRQKWLSVLARSSLLKKDLRVCSKHFCRGDFSVGVRFSKKKDLRLKPDALPHLHLGIEEDAACNYNVGIPSTSSSATPNIHWTSNLTRPSTPEMLNILPSTPVPVVMHDMEDTQCEDYEPVSPSESCRPVTPIPISEFNNIKRKLTKYMQKVDVLRKENAKLKTENNLLKENLNLFLNNDQLSSLGRCSDRGTKWSDETMTKAYKLRLTCGSTGYDAIREIGQPLPSQRTLQRRIEHLKFSPGILREVLTAIKVKVDLMVDEERHCAILIDEIAITPRLDFDPSTGLVLGRPSIPSSGGEFEEIATHGLVYMLAGVTTRWKQVIGYQFTGKSFSANSVKEDIETIIIEAEYMGLKVDCIVSDMGGQNQALWRLYNIRASRYSAVKNWAIHSCDPHRKLYFNPDPPHIFKNLRDHLTNGQKIIIPPLFVRKYSLPTNVVDIEHIRALIRIDSKDLKLAPYLNESCTKPSHYDKMKVGLALRLLNSDTAAALKYCTERKLLGNEVITTAWFCEIMHKWFKFVTSRTRTLALGTDNQQKYKDALHFLKEILELFQRIKIGLPNTWKPVQTGVLLATTNAIELSDYYITEKNFNYVCLGRFTQDALENLFSMIRFINPIPSPKFFKMALRIISVAQFFKPNRRGSYEIDDSNYLTDFLNTKVVSEMESEAIHLIEDFVDDINLDEMQSLYYVTGMTVNQVIKSMNLKCKICLKALKTSRNDPSIAVYKRLTELKALSKQIIYPTRDVFELLASAERYIRKFESCIIFGETKLSLISNSFLNSNAATFPSCHNKSKHRI